MRLIDGDALLETIEDHVTAVSCCPTVDWSRGKTQMKEQVIEDIRNAPTIGKWISVNERMPDAAGYECLVCAVNENTHQTHVFTAFTGYGEPGWWTSNAHYMSRAKSPRDNSLHPALRVTNWMPFPEPPEEEENAPN